MSVEPLYTQLHVVRTYFNSARACTHKITPNIYIYIYILKRDITIDASMIKNQHGSSILVYKRYRGERQEAKQQV